MHNCIISIYTAFRKKNLHACTVSCFPVNVATLDYRDTREETGMMRQLNAKPTTTVGPLTDGDAWGTSVSGETVTRGAWQYSDDNIIVYIYKRARCISIYYVRIYIYIYI